MNFPDFIGKFFKKGQQKTQHSHMQDAILRSDNKARQEAIRRAETKKAKPGDKLSAYYRYLANLQIAGDAIYQKLKKEREERKAYRLSNPVVLGAMVRMCPGNKHAWFESNIGLIRKPV